MTVLVRLFGEVEVNVDAHRLDVGHLRQQCALVGLLVDAGHAVPLDRLQERVWGDRAPPRARATLYGYLSRLRHALVGARDVAIVRRPGGYVVAVDPMAVDVHRFQHLLTRARAADDEEAADLFGQALALWRGEPFAQLDTAWLNSVRDRLERQRWAAELDRNDICLRHGRHGELIPALEEAAASAPLDERLAGQLIVALYRCGRQADALHHFHRARTSLVEELGADPGPALRRLHHQVLTADPALDLRPAAAAGDLRPAAVVGERPVPRQLPGPPAGFAGRAVELAALGRDATRLWVIAGRAGMGKTWLALRWAHDNLHRFPDGQLYLCLRGSDRATGPMPAHVALRTLLDALGVPAAAVPTGVEATSGRYRSLVAGRRLLVVLDDALDSDQVVPLLPGTESCTVLVTSRQPLPSLVAGHGGRPLAVSALTDTEARGLLVGRLGAQRVDAEPAAVATIVQRCGGRPLALGTVAARALLQPAGKLADLDPVDSTSTVDDAA